MIKEAFQFDKLVKEAEKTLVKLGMLKESALKIAEEEILTTEEDVVDFVQNNTKYISQSEVSKDILPYNVEYKGKKYESKDTRDLVIQICKDLGIDYFELHNAASEIEIDDEVTYTTEDGSKRKGLVRDYKDDLYTIMDSETNEVVDVYKTKVEKIKESEFAPYGWIIDVDHIADPKYKAPSNSNAVGMMGPSSISPEIEKKLLAGEGDKFKIYDDDKELYYEGRSINCEDDQPLYDFAQPNAGATSMIYEGEKGPRTGSKKVAAVKKFKVKFKEICDGYNGYDHTENREEVIEASSEEIVKNKLDRKYKGSSIEITSIEEVKEAAGDNPFYKVKPPKFEPGATPVASDAIKNAYQKLIEANSRIEAIKGAIKAADEEFAKKKKELEEKGQKLDFMKQFEDAKVELDTLLRTAQVNAVDVGDQIVGLWKREKENPFRPDSKWMLEKVIAKFPEAQAYLDKAIKGAQSLGTVEQLENVVIYPKRNGSIERKSNFMDIINGIKNDIISFSNELLGIKEGLEEVNSIASLVLSELK